MRRLAIAVLSLAFLAACRTATTELTEEQKAEIAAQVNALQAEYNAAAEAADFDGEMSHWTQSSETGWATTGRAFWDPEELAAAVADARTGWGTIARVEFTRMEARTYVLAPNVVYVMQRCAAIATDTAGVVTPEEEWVYTRVWTLQDGEWKIQFAHGSSPVDQTP